jgi:DNA-directed RNA polymerase subunit RPC12/RpoP
MVSIRKDFLRAKEQLLELNTKYSSRIIPQEVDCRAFIKSALYPDGQKTYSVIAYATGNKQGTKAAIVYDTGLVKDNMYNIGSKFFDALVVHEQCHVKHSFLKPNDNMKRCHSNPIYLDCMEKYFERGFARGRTHPDRYSVRAYLGSEDKVVPPLIHRSLFYKCKSCGRAFLWDYGMMGYIPHHCSKCSSDEVNWTKLNPFDVYRICKINEIDNFDKCCEADYE